MSKPIGLESAIIYLMETLESNNMKGIVDVGNLVQLSLKEVRLLGKCITVYTRSLRLSGGVDPLEIYGELLKDAGEPEAEAKS
jgi:hypothetical protein